MLIKVSGQSYYEAIVQVIPILLLTMAVGEARLRVRDTISIRTAILGVLFIGALLVAGEVAALHALEVGHGSRLTKDLTVIAVAVGLGWVVRSLAQFVYRDRSDGEEEPPPGIAVLIDSAFAATAVIVICALIF
ncbi:MAG TPA: hypothetical protein VFK14_04780 [Solirubrobacterales bacterium]|nr:hypothetical protein [Solirubrobacterales bacterium]